MPKTKLKMSMIDIYNNNTSSLNVQIIKDFDEKDKQQMRFKCPNLHKG